MEVENTALTTYQKTLDGLRRIADDFNVAGEQRAEATAAAQKISLDYAKTHG